MTLFSPFSFAVHNVLLTLLALFLLLGAAGAQDAPTNTTLRFNSPFVKFTPGWAVANFSGTGREFAFSNQVNNQVQITLPPNASAVFYQGFKVSGGGFYFACVDCNNTARSHIRDVDAHDNTENGTQPPVTLFSFTGLDPTVPHVLNVINIEDDRFNHTSQITFDSVIVTVGDSNSTSTSQGSSQSVSSTSPPSATGGGVNPISVTISTTSSATVSNPTSAPGSSGAAPPTTTAGATSSPGAGTTSQASQSSSGATTTDSGSGTQPTNVSSSSSGASGSSTTAASGSGSSQATQSLSSSGSASGSNPTGGSTTGGSNSSGSSNGAQPTGSTVTDSAGSQPTNSGSGSGSSTGSGSGSNSGTNTSSGAPVGGTSSPSNTGGGTTGVSMPVIIAVAVIASLVVLGLLAAITWLLVRSQPVVSDAEGSAGLMREATPPGAISGPVGLAPMRPVNPFAETVPPNVPLDEPSVADILAEPLPPPPPPPLPPKSPLRAAFGGSPRTAATPWISRTPRTPSPTSPV